jgi:hypothetical protein
MVQEPADEDVNIGLAVTVVPQLSFAGCANTRAGKLIDKTIIKMRKYGWVLMNRI